MRHRLNLCLFAIAILIIGGCVSAPLDYPKESSTAIADTSATKQAMEAADWLGGRTDVNGFYPLQ